MTTEMVPKSTGRTLAVIEREIARDPRLKSGHSRRGYLHDLRFFEEWRGGRPMTKLLAEEYLAHLQGEGKSPNTVNRALAAIRWWARRMGDLAFEDRSLSKEEREEIVTQTARIASIEDVRGSRLKRGRYITKGELEALMEACGSDPSPAGIRDGAIIALAWFTGARRSELASLSLADYQETGEGEGDLTIRGKGDKERKVYIYNGGAEALADWLTVRGDEPGPLFYPVNKGGTVQEGQGLSGQALAQMLAKRESEAGVKHLTWHDFRRSFVANLLSNSVDVVTISRLTGHSSVDQTAQYDPRGEEVKRQAAQSLHFAYRRRRLSSN